MSKLLSRSDMLHLVEWAAAECDRQQSGEKSVYWMLRGWDWVMQGPAYPSGPHYIQELGSIVEPRWNKPGQWRQMDVMVGMDRKGPWEEVPRQMEALFAAWGDLTANEWYREFEEIHPFRDGNGRVGSILWNLHRRSLAPVNVAAPPDFWSGS